MGKIVEVRGPRNYLVRVRKGSKLVHADHMVRAVDTNFSEVPQSGQSEPVFPDPVTQELVVPSIGTESVSITAAGDTTTSSSR